MPYIDWQYTPRARKPYDKPWAIDVMSDGTVTVRYGTDELQLSAKIAAELAEMIEGVQHRWTK